MLERMFIQDEREELKDDQLVAKEDPGMWGFWEKGDRVLQFV